MNVRDRYSQYIIERNIKGSNKAPSYIRALNLLDGILTRIHLFDLPDFWSVDSIDEIEKLYQYALHYQKKVGSPFLRQDLPQSYGRNGYYSAALKSYREFLILNRHENKLWDLVDQPNINLTELSKSLDAQVIDSIEGLVDQDVDFSSEEGKEVLRKTKQRVNQSRFRKLILREYESQCCVSGLSIPEVLRASHIVGWAVDKENQMNPANGLCLSATYDAAFDRHLISFDEEFRMILSPALKEYCNNDAFKTQFVAFEGQPITKPKRFSPDPVFLERHRKKLVT